MANIESLRELLYEVPSEALWFKLCHALDQWHDSEMLEVGLDYIQGHMAAWPRDLPTFAPNHFFKREPAQIKADPRTAFFTRAFMERTEGHFRQKAELFLAQYKPLKPLKFMDLDVLGHMRWRTGEPFDENDGKRLVALLRTEARRLPNTDLEQLRQLLNDDDCIRWHNQINKQWQAAGGKSQPWVKPLAMYFGTLAQMKLSPHDSGNAASKRIDQLAVLGGPKAHAMLADMVYKGNPMRTGPERANSGLRQCAQRLGLDPSEFTRQLSDTFKQSLAKEKQAVLTAATEGVCSAEVAKTFAETLHNAMILQRDMAFGGHLQTIFAVPVLQSVLAPVIWRTGQKMFFRWDASGLIDLNGEPVTLGPSNTVTVAHPASMTASQRKKWGAHLAAKAPTPLFEQLERPIHKLGTSLIKSPIPVADLHFFDNHGWTADNYTTGTEYADSTCLLSTLQNWRLTVHLNYTINLFGPGGDTSDGSPAMTKMTVEKLMTDGPDVRKDPVSYSEACLEIERLISSEQEAVQDARA